MPSRLEEKTISPILCLVTKNLGQTSEVWLWRQVVGFSRFRPSIVTWDYVNMSDYPIDTIPIFQLPFNPDPEHASGFERWSFRLKNLPGLNFYGAVGKEKETLKKLLLQMNPTVILAHFGSKALRLLPLAEELRIPLVAHFHGVDISSSLKNRWYRWSLLRHAKKFAAIIIVGNHQSKWFLEQGIPEYRIHVIPCGVPTKQFSPPLTRRLDLINYVTVSRLVEQKGLKYTISAFHRVSNLIENARLTVIGDGPTKNELQLFTKSLQISDKVQFIGSCPPIEVKKHLAEGHIFLQHSLWAEGSPVSLAEAAAMELPVVATRCGGIIEQVIDGETGYLVDQKDINGMSEAMIKLAQDKNLRKTMGRAGRTRMVNYFDTEMQIKKLENLLLSQIGTE